MKISDGLLSGLIYTLLSVVSDHVEISPDGKLAILKYKITNRNAANPVLEITEGTMLPPTRYAIEKRKLVKKLLRDIAHRVRWLDYII